MQKLCRLMCPFEQPTSDAQQSSIESIDVSENLGVLQQGQLVNSEEIQALLEAITHITSVMTQFQTFMDNHSAQNDATVKASIQTEYGNHDNFSDTSKSINDISFVSNECANLNVHIAPDIDNAPELSNDANGSQHCHHEEPTSIIGNSRETLLCIINNSVEHVEKATYATVVRLIRPS